MLTVRDSDQDKVAALDAGADDFITKPFSTPELLARIRAALRRTPMCTGGGNSARYIRIRRKLISRHARSQPGARNFVSRPRNSISCVI